MGKGKRVRAQREEAPPQRPKAVRVERPSVAKERRTRMRHAFRQYQTLPTDVKRGLEAEAIKMREEQDNERHD